MGLARHLEGCAACLWQTVLCCQHPAPDTLFLNSSPRKSPECASLPKMSIGPHLFPAQGPSVTLSLLETTQDTKLKAP